MQSYYHYTTVLNALKDLKRKGFMYDFNLNYEIIVKNPHDYTVEYIYRYDGDSNPEEEPIVYGISSSSGKKGVFVSGSSANSDRETSPILEKLSIQNNTNFNI